MNEQTDMPCGLLELRVKAANETAVGQDYVDWAVRMMVEGHESPALIDLAGLDLDGRPVERFDAVRLFDKAIIELGISSKNEEELFRLWLVYRASQIIKGVITPTEGVELIHDEVISPLMHPKDLMPWCYARDGIFFDANDRYMKLSDDEQIYAIMALAEKYAQLR